VGLTAFVLGGGGRLGAAEVGMLQALDAAGIRPGLVVGTSVGAINGALVAADPEGAAERLGAIWTRLEESGVFTEGLRDRVRHLWASGVALHSAEPLADLLRTELGADATFEALVVPFACVAACIETAAPAWFDSGPLIPALLASCAVPGLLPPVLIDGRHHLDGGLVDSIPLQRAVDAGATEIFVLQVGRIEQPLRPPTNPRDVATVAFEISRRHRFTSTLATLPEGVAVHILPTGGTAPPPEDLRANLRYGQLGGTAERIASARAATAAYLEQELAR
jgi:NTE family protein